MKNTFGRTSIFRNFAIGLGYLAVIVYLGAKILFGGVSNYLVSRAAASNSIPDCSTAIQFNPDNYEAYQLRSQLLAGNGDIPGGISDLRTAIEFRPADYQLWLRLGNLYSLNGESSNALAAFARSIELAPHYISPKMKAGQYFLNEQNLHAAFQHLNLAANKDEGLYPTVLDLAKAALSQGISFDHAIQPISNEAKKIVAMYVIQNGLDSPSTEKFLTSDELADDTKSGFTNKLLEHGNFGLGFRVWASKSGNKHYTDETSDNVLINGGFEDGLELLNRGYGWVIEQNTPNVQVRATDSISLEGRKSVELEFRGNSVAAASILSQLVLLRPNRLYRLTFAAYHENPIVSGGPPLVTISDPRTSMVLAQSMPIEPSTRKWVNYELNFRSTDEQTAAAVKIRRLECPTSTCPAFGQIRFDKFVIVAID